MSSHERDSSRDRGSLVLKHQHSVSDIVAGRAVPMWDSSDPGRAPPPLPLNPTTSSPNPTRPGTSSHVAETAKLLQEKARESLPSPYTKSEMAERSSERSPERSLVKGAAHRRLQSLQTNSVKDLRTYLDGAKSPERPLNLSSTPSFESVSRPGSPDKRESRSTTPTPTLSQRRAPPKAILGENTPPSAAMLALQTMPVRDFPEPAPLGNITNLPSATSVRSPPGVFSGNESSGLSTQIVALTNIAVSLQREMQALSRRSKDNATDLVQLKAATNSRDEDIRKSLRDLVFKVNEGMNPHKAFGIAFLDGEDEQRNSMRGTKTLSLPRMPSPYGASEDGKCGSPKPFEREAGIAMLEKIIREMVTKDGQDNLLSQLSTLLKKTEKESGITAQKVAELVEFIKSSGHNQSLIRAGGGGNGPPQIGSLPFDDSAVPGPLTVSKDVTQKPYSSPRAADFVTNDIIKMLKKMMESIKQSGITTNEVKTNQNELMRHVQGMGRDLASKLEALTRGHDSSRAIEDGASKKDIASIVQEGIASIKEHLDSVMREKRRQSSSTVVSRASVDNREVYDLVKHALAERDVDRGRPGETQLSDGDKEAILKAVREACEEFKPEIELQQFGLERDEILQCLKEGLEDYRKDDTGRESPAIQRQELMAAVHEAMQNFHPPPPINEMQELRDEMIQMVRESLDQVHPNSRESAAHETEITRNILVDVVRDTLRNYDPGARQDLSINRNDLFDAVRVGLESSGTPFGHYGEQVMKRLRDILDEMRNEFKNQSTGNGRDTEQVLDAMKDGLQSLRGEIESYVDRSQDVTGKSEIIDAVRSGLELLRSDVEGYVAAGPPGEIKLDNMLSYIKSEFGHLHEVVKDGPTGGVDQQVLLNAIHAGYESLRANVGTREFGSEDGEEMNGTMKEEFALLKDAVLSGSGSHRDDVLVALKDGFAIIEARLDDAGADRGSGMSALKEELEHLRNTLATTMIRHGGEIDAAAIADAVREAVESSPRDVSTGHDALTKETIDAIHENVNHIRESLSSCLVPSGSGANKEEILETLRQGMEDMKGGMANADSNSELAEAMQGEFEKLRQSIATSVALGGRRADNEEVLDAVRLGLDDLQSHLDKKLENPDRWTQATGEFLDALNDGIEGLRADVVKIVDKPVDMTVSYEILDTLKSGISELRAEMDKLKGRGESRDTNRAGNEIVLADGSEVNADREVAPPDSFNSDALRRDDLSKVEVLLAQLQIKVEAMDANIQTPLPAAERDVPTEPLGGFVLKEDIVQIEDMLKDLQATVNVIGTHDKLEGVARKDDTDAIETLLRNTKAHLEESLLNPETAVTKEHIQIIDTLLRDMSGRLDQFKEMATQMDVTVVEVIASDVKKMLEEVKSGLEADRSSEEKLEKKHVDTLGDTLGDVCKEIKQKVEEMKLPDPESLPSKAEFEQLQGLINDFRESHDKMKDGYETDIQVTARAFDDRKKEAEDMLESIAGVKSFLEEVKNELTTKVEEANTGVGTIFDSVKGLEATMVAGFSVSDDVKKLTEVVNTEFEKANTSIQFLKELQSQKAEEHQEKAEERKTAVISEVTAKLDEHFVELMSKYDDAQVAAEVQAKVMEEKATEQATILAGTKEMAEELRLTIDTLGTAVTTMQTTFEETREKLNDESNFKILFDKIEESCAKVDGSATENKSEGQLTRDTLRDEVSKAVTAVESLKGEVTEYHPQFMVALREIQALVNQHYEHSQKAQEVAQETARSASENAKSHAEEISRNFSALPSLLPAAQPLPAIEPVVVERFNDAEVLEKLDKLTELVGSATKTSEVLEKLDKLMELADAAPENFEEQLERDAEVLEKLDKLMELAGAAPESSEEQLDRDAEVLEKLDKLMELVGAAPEQPLPAIEPVVVERFNDAEVLEKLDKLTELAGAAPKTSEVQLERLDKIHEQVMATAAEVSALMASQKRFITETQENHEKELEEMRALLERRQIEKEQVELDLERLRSDKESLSNEVEDLRCDRDALLADKNQLSRDVSSIQTALDIRREELKAMHHKADEIHERILQGLMDQSRALMIARSAKSAVPREVKKVGTPQRMASNISHSTIDSLPPPSAAVQGLALALKTRPGMKRSSIPGNVPGSDGQKAARRIMSLSQITGNSTPGAKTYLGPTMNPRPGTLSGGMKRSHSVKTQWPRKASWNADRETKSRVVSVSEVDEDKENGSNDVDSNAVVLVNPMVDTGEDIVVIQEEDDSITGAERDLEESEAGTVRDAETERRASQRTVTDTIDSESVSDCTETASDSGETEDRRSSNGTVVTGSGDSDVSYATGSYLTGSDIGTETENDRRSSYGSSVLSELTTGAALDDGAMEASDDETSEGDVTVTDVEVSKGEEETPKSEDVDGGATPSELTETETHVGSESEEPYPTKKFVEFNTPAPSDNGLGSDSATANIMSGSETDYFRRKMEDDASTLSGV